MILSGLVASHQGLRNDISLSLTSHLWSSRLFRVYSNDKEIFELKNAIFMSKSLIFLLHICHSIIFHRVTCLLEDSFYWMKLKWTKSKQIWIPLVSSFPSASPFHLLISWRNSSTCKHAWKVCKMSSKTRCWQFRICQFRLMICYNIWFTYRKAKVHASFFPPSLVKSILRSPGGKLFLELVFILLVRLKSVKTALKPAALRWAYEYWYDHSVLCWVTLLTFRDGEDSF